MLIRPLAVVITLAVPLASLAADEPRADGADRGAEVKISSDFEGGSVGRVEQLSDNHWRCAVRGESDQDQRNRQPSWFYFRLDGVAGRALTIDLTDLGGEYNYRPHKGAGVRNMRPVYSHDNRTWQHVESSEWDENTSTTRIHVKASADRIWIARIAPYTTAHLKRLLDDLRGHPHLQAAIVGKTVEERPIELLTVTNPQVADSGKSVVWLMARQHAWEAGTSWVAEGALRFVLSDDPAAVRIRERCILKVFPMADPDGVVRGGVRFNVHGYDLNRNWDAVDAQRMPEIYAQRKAIWDWLDSGHRIDLFLAMHNTESSDFISGPPAARPLAERFWKLLVDGTTFHSPEGPRIDTVGTTTPGMKGRMTVYQALARERQVPAFLMEQMVDVSPKLSRPPTVADRIEFGAGLIRAMCAAVEDSAGEE